MNELRFRIEFATPFRVGSGYGAPGVDGTVDVGDPLPASSLKGVMRATAVELGLTASLVDTVFGTPAQPSPWAWSSAVPVTGDRWSDPQIGTRVALDAHHAATTDMLAMAEQIAAGAAEFTVTRQHPVPSTDEPDPQAVLLAVAGQATRSLGGARRRGLGWVQITCATLHLTREHVALLLGAP